MWFGRCWNWFGAGPGGWGWMMGGGVMMLLFLVGLIIVGVWAVRSWQGGPMRTQAHPGLEALNLRYARGEISKAEYEEMRRDIER